MRDFVLSHSIEVIHIATSETENPDHAYYVRVFGPAFGYLEYPATGSANAAFGYYLSCTGLWDGNPMQLARGPDVKTPNIVHVSRASDGSMMFGGQAVGTDCRVLLYVLTCRDRYQNSPEGTGDECSGCFDAGWQE
ncbi:MAG: PhzF family phenazine biosynthesis protein [Methanospirillaceae archaeon]|nr:PhzF family phenazine biosynthesis protein [Methanospirillaceae archaeon]